MLNLSPWIQEFGISLFPFEVPLYAQFRAEPCLFTDVVGFAVDDFRTSDSVPKRFGYVWMALGKFMLESVTQFQRGWDAFG